MKKKLYKQKKSFKKRKSKIKNLIKLEEESWKFFILRPTQKFWCRKY